MAATAHKLQRRAEPLGLRVGSNSFTDMSSLTWTASTWSRLHNCQVEALKFKLTNSACLPSPLGCRWKADWAAILRQHREVTVLTTCILCCSKTAAVKTGSREVLLSEPLKMARDIT
jgi:hypothetical protein